MLLFTIVSYLVSKLFFFFKRKRWISCTARQRWNGMKNSRIKNCNQLAARARRRGVAWRGRVRTRGKQIRRNPTAVNILCDGILFERGIKSAPCGTELVFNLNVEAFEIFDGEFTSARSFAKIIPARIYICPSEIYFVYFVRSLFCRSRSRE